MTPSENPISREPGPLQTAEGVILCKHDYGTWFNATGDHVPSLATSAPRVGDARMTPCMALEDLWI